MIDSQPKQVVVARVTRSSRQWTAGQRVYCFTWWWGMGERARVVGRHRRKGRWIHGVVRIAYLEACRPKLVHTPAVLHKMGVAVHEGMDDSHVNDFLQVWRAERDRLVKIEQRRASRTTTVPHVHVPDTEDPD